MTVIIDSPATAAPAMTDLATFRDHAVEVLDRLAASGGVEYLTVDGEAKGVVLSPAAYESMADRIEQAEITEGIRRGLADVAAGQVIPAREAMEALAAELGLDFHLPPE